MLNRGSGALPTLIKIINFRLFSVFSFLSHSVRKKNLINFKNLERGNFSHFPSPPIEDDAGIYSFIHFFNILEELASCPDPGDVNHAERTVLSSSVKVGGHFLQDSRIQYRCKAGFEQMGVSKILCTFDGSWSNRLPACIKGIILA